MSFTATLPEVEPGDGVIVVTRLTGEIARDFVAMLNMNGVRDSQGRRLTFRWVKVGVDENSAGEEWTMEVTMHEDNS